MGSATTFPVNGLYGLVICGGRSSRMGMDKALLDYHGKPQCNHLYEMLKPFCESVFISCTEQLAEQVGPDLPTLIDLPYYSETGPIAGLLSALTSFSHKNFLMIGCDYPFLDKDELLGFLPFCNGEKPGAFYNKKEGLYEPMLAYYPNNIKHMLLEMFEERHFSLQDCLQTADALKYFPANIKTIRSVDTKEAFIETKHLLELSE